MNIPPIGMGTWGMGGKYEQDPTNVQESIEALRYGLELGFRLIDTAELYGAGLTETIVGEAIRGYRREDIFIISKVWKTNLHYHDVIGAAEGSLRRLGINYIDLYLVHWPNETMPLTETMRAMEYLGGCGLIRNLGVSNFSADQMRQAQTALRHMPLAASQFEYNLLERSAEKEIIPFCRANHIKAIAHRPLTKGVMQWSKSEIMRLLGKKYGKTSSQIALNWLICRDLVPIPKSASPAHLLENYGALGWRLEDRDLSALDHASFSR